MEQDPSFRPVGYQELSQNTRVNPQGYQMSTQVQNPVPDAIYNAPNTSHWKRSRSKIFTESVAKYMQFLYNELDSVEDYVSLTGELILTVDTLQPIRLSVNEQLTISGNKAVSCVNQSSVIESALNDSGNGLVKNYENDLVEVRDNIKTEQSWLSKAGNSPYEDEESNALDCTFDDSKDQTNNDLVTTSEALDSDASSKQQLDAKQVTVFDTRKVKEPLPKRLKGLSGLPMEQRKHTNQCPVCDETFGSFKTPVFEHHMRNIHPDEKPFTCDICSKGFSTPRYLHEHQKYMHKFKKIESRNVETCQFCDRKILARNMKGHLLKHAAEDGLHTFDSQPGSNSDSNIDELCVRNDITTEQAEEGTSLNIEAESLALDCKLDKFDHSITKSHTATKVRKVKAVCKRRRPKSLPESSKRPRKSMNQCPVCPKTFGNVAVFVSHMRTSHPEEKPFTCDICPKSFTNQTSLLKHQKMVHLFKRPVHQCPVCEETFTGFKTPAFERHMTTIHPGVKPFTCQICFKAFQNPNQVSTHEKLQHTDRKMETCQVCGKDIVARNMKNHLLKHSDNRPYICEFCGDGFPTADALKLHTLTHPKLKPSEENYAYSGEIPFSLDLSLNPTPSQPREVDKNDSPSKQEKKHKCPICGDSFEAERLLQYHMRSHPGAKPFACDLCPKTFSNPRYLSEHKKNIHIESYMEACHICGKMVSQRTMKKHLKVHSDHRPYVCGICGATYKESSQLKFHKMRHTDERPHVCHICSKGFITEGSLREHLKCHFDHRPFKCDQCDSSFKRNTHLTTHMKTHRK